MMYSQKRFDRISGKRVHAAMALGVWGNRRGSRTDDLTAYCATTVLLHPFTCKQAMEGHGLENLVTGRPSSSTTVSNGAASPGPNSRPIRRAEIATDKGGLCRAGMAPTITDHMVEA